MNLIYSVKEMQHTSNHNMRVLNETDAIFAELDMDSIEHQPANHQESSSINNNKKPSVISETKDSADIENRNIFVTSTTPVVSKSIKDKFKAALKSNARSVSPQISKLQRLRRDSMEVALLQATELYHRGDQYDIGPFYGLPSKVQELLGKVRGITNLYGKRSQK